MSAMDCLRSPWQAAKMAVKAYSPALWKEVRTEASAIEDEYTQKQFLLIVYIYAAFSEMYCTDDVEAERKAAPFIQKIFRLRRPSPQPSPSMGREMPGREKNFC